MKAKRIIPCLDVTEGRVVKGTSFVDLKDAGDPVELAKRYNEEGADELVFLDITASSDKRYILKDVVEATAKAVFIPFTVGGGIQDVATIQDLLNAGADKISINTAAVKNPDLVANASRQYGSQCIVVAIDARKKTSGQLSPDAKKYREKVPQKVWTTPETGWEVYIHGGRTATGIDAIKWAQLLNELGAGEILLTSMDQDGTQAGYDIPLLKAVVQETHCPVIASGGAGTCEHIAEALQVCDAALLASLLHFKIVSIAEIKAVCTAKKIAVRPI